MMEKEYYENNKGETSMKRWLAALSVAIALAVPGAALAYSVQSGDEVTVPKGETREGTFYASGQIVTIDGTVDGDLICAGQTVNVNGPVRGDVICAGQTVTINGAVDGDVRVAGQTVAINGKVGRNVTVMGQTATLGSSAEAGGDMAALGQAITVNGTVAKSLHGAMNSLMIGGTAGSVDVQAMALALGQAGRVQGDLRYTSERALSLDKAKVGGQIQHRAMPQEERRENTTAEAWLATRFFWILAGLVIGLTLVLVAPRFMRRIAQEMQEQPGASIGWGILVMLLGPILAVLVAMTVIGLPLGALIGGLWLVLVLTSGLLASIAAGQWLLRRADWHKDSLVWATLLGVPLGIIVYGVPVLGALVGLIAAWWAIGGVALSAKALRA